MSKDVILTPEQIAAEERRWLFDAPIAELAEVKGVTVDEAVKLRTDAILQEAAVPIEVTVRPIEPQGKLIGFASVNYGGVVIDDFKVVDTGKTPLLQDLYEELLKQPEPEARRVATALELYCTGSLNLFNHPTNVKTDSRVVCIVLKNMGENLRKIAMHITNEFVSQAVDTNFREGVATWCYFDEFHVLLRDPLTASYFVAVWKMLRKKGCVPSALTQNVKVRPDRALCKAV